MLMVEHSWVFLGEMPSTEKDYSTRTLIASPEMSLPLWWLVLEIQRPNTFVLIWITSLKDRLSSSAPHGISCNCMQSTFSLCPTPLRSCLYKRSSPKTSCIAVSDFESDCWWTWPKTNALSHLIFMCFYCNPVKGKSVSTSFLGFDWEHVFLSRLTEPVGSRREISIPVLPALFASSFCCVTFLK